MINNSQTGQLLQSQLENCPVFIPSILNEKLLSQLRVENHCEVPCYAPFKGLEEVLNTYFLRFFAGDKNMERGFADIPAVELYLWKRARFITNIKVKKVCHSSKRFEKTLKTMAKLTPVSQSSLIKLNTQLRPTADNHGIRRFSMKAGNPKNNPNAFYCLPVEMVSDYMSDLISYINDGTFVDINKALMAFMQFIFIHPFRDGNGRVGRLLLLALMQKNHGSIYAYVFMLYLKNINRLDYHAAVNLYQHGDIEALRQFYLKAIDWTNQSTQLLTDLLNNYLQKITPTSLKANSDYWQVIIRQHPKKRYALDEDFFKLFAINSDYYIYINSPLLSCLNQFDYYLRDELRQNKQKYL